MPGHAGEGSLGTTPQGAIKHGSGQGCSRGIILGTEQEASPKCLRGIIDFIDPFAVFEGASLDNRSKELLLCPEVSMNQCVVHACLGCDLADRHA